MPRNSSSLISAFLVESCPYLLTLQKDFKDGYQKEGTWRGNEPGELVIGGQLSPGNCIDHYLWPSFSYCSKAPKLVPPFCMSGCWKGAIGAKSSEFHYASKDRQAYAIMCNMCTDLRFCICIKNPSQKFIS